MWFSYDHADESYLSLMNEILSNGEVRSDRTGVGTKSLFGPQLAFDLSKGFPLLTTKKMPFRIIAEELFWFLSGKTNIRPLLEKGVKIWSDWPHKKYNEESGENLTLEEFEERILKDESFAYYWGDLGPVYGRQWRNFRGVDQIKWAMEQLRNNPTSRRIVVSAWNPPDIEFMALPPCHTLFQFYVRDADGQTPQLDCKMYQRSADYFLGVPFNIASYALLTHIVAHCLGFKPGRLIISFGDVHIYLNHLNQVKEQMARKPYPMPSLTIDPNVKDLFEIKYEHLTLSGYNSHPTIKAPIAV